MPRILGQAHVPGANVDAGVLRPDTESRGWAMICSRRRECRAVTDQPSAISKTSMVTTPSMSPIVAIRSFPLRCVSGMTSSLIT